MKKIIGPCSVKGCPKPLKVRGLCRGHYSRRFEHKYSNWDKLLRSQPWTQVSKYVGCSVPDCSNRHYSLSLCQYHYNCRRHFTKASKLDAPVCTVRGCGLTHTAHGLCVQHLQNYTTANYNEISRFLLDITEDKSNV